MEIIPYHCYGGAKSVALGKADSGNTNWIPSKEQTMKAKEYLHQRGINIFNMT